MDENQIQKINYWLDISEYDLETAKAMLNGRRYLYVGFMCHQAIEKVLKAYFVFSQDQTPPHTHSLSLLAQQSKLNKLFSEPQLELIDILEPLNIESRYPTYKEQILKTLSLERCKEIIKKTEELFNWIKNKSLNY